MDIRQRIRQFVISHPGVLNVLLVILSVGFTIWICELGFRIFVATTNPVLLKTIQRFSTINRNDQSSFSFIPHPYLCYAPKQVQYTPDGITINNQSFQLNKPTNTIRIACLGGSTTMNQYGYVMSIILNRQPSDTNYEVMDFGCNAWSLNESTINYIIRVNDFKPDIVFVHHGVNDFPPRVWPDFKPDYSHYRKPWSVSWHHKIIRDYFAWSWMTVYLLHRSGVHVFDLQDFTSHRTKPSERNPIPSKETFIAYERNLRMLHAMTSASNSQLVLAPMAYNHTDKDKNLQTNIEDSNQIMRRYAQEYNLPLVETDNYLKHHPEWFLDIAHLKDNGNYLKAQIYSIAVNLLQQDKNVTIINQIKDTDKFIQEERDLTLSWNFTEPNIREYHLFVRSNREKQFHYIGRTRSPHVTQFRWKAGYRQPDMIYNPKFTESPKFGTFYHFKVAAISNDNPPKVLRQFTTPKNVRVTEQIPSTH
jgi:hypothetical protein